MAMSRRLTVETSCDDCPLKKGVLRSKYSFEEKVPIISEILTTVETNNILNESSKFLESKKMRKISKSIIFLGKSSVGKTSIILRFVKKPFRTEYFETIGVNYYAKESETEYGSIAYSLWDTNGDEIKQRILNSFIYKSANAFVIVCSYDDNNSIKSIGNYIDLITRYKQHTNNESYNNYLIPIFIVINKAEIPVKERVFSSEKLREMVKDFNLNINIIEVSAKENKGIDFLFVNIVVGMFGNYSDMSLLKDPEIDITFDTMLNPKKRKFRILKKETARKKSIKKVGCC